MSTDPTLHVDGLVALSAESAKAEFLRRVEAFGADVLASRGDEQEALDLVRFHAERFRVDPAAAVQSFRAGSESKPDEDDVAQQHQKRSMSTRAVQLAAPQLQLFHSPDRTAYAEVHVDGNRQTWALDSRGFQYWLQKVVYDAEGTALGSQALKVALEALAAKALFDGPEREIFVRVAPTEGVTYIDLGAEDWAAVEVTARGWRSVREYAVHFRRPAGLQRLPPPASGGDLGDLRAFLNVRTEADYRLVVAWLLAALRGVKPFPICVLQGEQGSGKSTVAKVLRELVDPSTVPLRSPPRSEHDLVIAANNAWLVAIDNLSGIPARMSDWLCRLATGGGFGTRQLYRDTDETLFNSTRPILLNGIDDLLTRPDLADRAVALHLPSISSSKRQTERAFWGAFREAAPRIFGALLDALVGVQAILPAISLAKSPRMADFAVLGAAAEVALGWPKGSFLSAYEGSRTELVEQGLDSDSVAVAVRALMADERVWRGTATELSAELARRIGEGTLPPDWPRGPRALSDRLNRLAPGLRVVGIRILRRKSGRRLTILERFREPAPCAPTATTVRTAGPEERAQDRRARG